jgi:hypothetical protein
VYIERQIVGDLAFFLLALVPPLWFYVMDPRLPERSQLETA